jgi:hypothetical protein
MWEIFLQGHILSTAGDALMQDGVLSHLFLLCNFLLVCSCWLSRYKTWGNFATSVAACLFTLTCLGWQLWDKFVCSAGFSCCWASTYKCWGTSSGCWQVPVCCGITTFQNHNLTIFWKLKRVMTQLITNLWPLAVWRTRLLWSCCSTLVCSKQWHCGFSKSTHLNFFRILHTWWGQWNSRTHDESVIMFVLDEWNYDLMSVKTLSPNVVCLLGKCGCCRNNVLTL